MSIWYRCQEFILTIQYQNFNRYISFSKSLYIIHIFCCCNKNILQIKGPNRRKWHFRASSFKIFHTGCPRTPLQRLRVRCSCVQVPSPQLLIYSTPLPGYITRTNVRFFCPCANLLQMLDRIKEPYSRVLAKWQSHTNSYGY